MPTPQKPKSSEQNAGDTWAAMVSTDDPMMMVDRPIDLKCPHCGAHSHLVATSTPRWIQMVRYAPKKVLIGYLCGACREPIALKFGVHGDLGGASLSLSKYYEEIERPLETFEFQHLPETVATDFREALVSFSHNCPNATAAMCRRTIQSVAENVGAAGSARVQSQIRETRDLMNLDGETFEALEEVMLGGHDGSHPNLPRVDLHRAAILVDLMKDVLRQLYVRKAAIAASKQLRQTAIEQMKKG